MCSSPLLQHVDEVWSVVARDPNLIGCHASVHVIPLASETLAVLSSQHSVHEDCAAQKAEYQVSQDDSVTCPESWSFFDEVDVG